MSRKAVRSDIMNVVTRWLTPNPSDLIQAAEALRGGRLVAFPTETVYGLGADARNAAAVRRIFAAKGRPACNPLIVHLGDASSASAVVTEWPETAQRLAERFWPGPLTLVLPKRTEIPAEVTAGLMSVGLRVPNHPVALELLRLAGIPVAAPSANPSSNLSPTTAQHVYQRLQGRVDFVIDGGPCPGGIESTVLDLTVTPPRILRPGLVTAEALRPFIGPVELVQSTLPGEPLKSPGMMPRHYAPTHPLELTDGDGSERVRELVAGGLHVGWLTWGGASNVEGCRRINMPEDPRAYAARLYAALHEADNWPVDRIVVATPPDTPEWLAVRDRLIRAAHS